MHEGISHVILHSFDSNLKNMSTRYERAHSERLELRRTVKHLEAHNESKHTELMALQADHAARASQLQSATKEVKELRAALARLRSASSLHADAVVALASTWLIPKVHFCHLSKCFRPHI